MEENLKENNMYKGKLLSSSRKTKKSDDAQLGYLTKILYLAPHKLSGVNICPHASAGCIAACLNKSGFGFYPVVQKGRIDKTLFYLHHRVEFIKRLIKEIRLFSILCSKKGVKPAIRLNGTSDLRWEKITPQIFTSFPEVQFYDYTKNKKRMIEWCAGLLPLNYHLTFSRSESNQDDVKEVVKAGGNVAVVFRVSKGFDFPKTYLRKKVISGDLTDLRFLDGKGIIGLSAKGVGRTDSSGFVLNRKR